VRHGDACTAGDACSNGTCHGEPVDCGHCLACDPATGCPPPPVCRAPDRPARARLVVSTRPSGRRLRFKWRGGRIPLADFGDPTRTDGYEVCVTGDGPPASIWRGSAGAGFLCADGESCWRSAEAGFRWRGRTAGAGLRSIRLRAGTGRKATIVVRADDGDGGLPPLPWPTPLTVQVRSASGTCWQSTFAALTVLASLVLSWSYLNHTHRWQTSKGQAMPAKATKVAVSVPTDLFEAVERARRNAKKTRSAVVQDALRQWLRREAELGLVRDYEAGYLRHPEGRDEIDEATATAVGLLARDDEW
jgi:hypothetical protein